MFCQQCGELIKNDDEVAFAYGVRFCGIECVKSWEKEGQDLLGVTEIGALIVVPYRPSRE